MIKKINRIQFFLFTSLAVVIIFFYVLGIPQADSGLSISSHNTSENSFAYILSSLFSFSHYYVGDWYLFAFPFFVIINTFSTRRCSENGLLLIPYLYFFASFNIFYLLFPSLVGRGLYLFSEEYTDTYIIFFTSLATIIAMCFLIFGNSFTLSLVSLSLKLKLSVKSIRSILIEAINFSKEITLRFLGKSIYEKKLLAKENLKKQHINNVIEVKSKNGISKLDTLTVPIEEFSSSINKEKELNELVDSNNSVSTIDRSEAYEQNTTEKINSDRPEVNDKFYEAKILIDCISQGSEHTKQSVPDGHYFETIVSTIESKLKEFRVDGRIINILKGPVVDTFELELGEGIKASKVKGLEDDIGLALNGAPIRVVYPLKGRSTIGVEVPRNPREFIYLDEVLQTESFNESLNRLPVAMGKDAFGETMIVDLAAMPHMLVAGATGAGKSVFVNTLLVSLIIKKSPQELKLILIDPKQLELALFATLPHLLLPVITEASKAAVSLLWAVEEMDKRYSILKNLGVKNIEGFNKKIKNASPAQLSKIYDYYDDADNDGYELPYIVIVIDEFADLILTKSGKDVEVNVNRLAAKARAAGIHLVLATQRPSTDVITGVIKANFPTRVAFRVTTGHDSKTILDQHGAQKLLGKGDMLYKHGVDLLRLHSSFVDEKEIEVLVDKLSSLNCQYSESAMEFLEKENSDGSNGESEAVSSSSYTSGTTDDPVYNEAIDVVIETGSASASMLQRRLRVGYNRAANIIDELEKNGIVGPAQGSKPRKVLRSS